VVARGLGLAALAVALILGTVGCGGVASSNVAEATGGELTVYSSLPLQGASASDAEQIVGGEKLALADAGGRAGPFKIGYVSLDDANPKSGRWDPDTTLANAKKAAQDTSTIAYLGDLDSAATAISLPLINAAGIVQVSAASPYVGLTSSYDAGQDEPERFYPSGKRTFARLQPGETVEAAAQVKLMGQLGVRRLYVLDDQDPFDVPLAQIVSGDAQGAGIDVLAHDSISTDAGSTFTGEVEKIAASGAQAVFLAGGQGESTPVLWRELHEADPHLLLLGSSGLVDRSFTARIGPAAANTYLTNPVLSPNMYPPPAQSVLADYRRTFGVSAGPYALYGYESMTLVLDAIRDAGARGDDRQTVIDSVLSTHDRRSVIGEYSIEPNGETTLTRYGIDRVVGGRAVFYQAIEAPPPSGQ
jgi:branched-chain amino acid transport system substrate-binding protein